MKPLNLTLCLLLATSPAFAKKKPAAPPLAPFSNTATFPQSCDAVWPITIQVFSAHGFDPKTSDKAGGILAFSWRKGGSGWVAAGKDVKALTFGSKGFLVNYDDFVVDGATAALFASEAGGCKVQISVRYQALRNAVGSRGDWIALESNNRMEQAVLDEIKAAMK